MASLIEELQRDRLNWQIPVAELLHRCLVLATKLDVKELADWVRFELDGYDAADAEVPKYRRMGGLPQVFNPYRGYQPLVFEDAEIYKQLSSMLFYHPISEIEDMLTRADRKKEASLHFTFPPQLENTLRKSIKFGLQPSLCVHVSQLKRTIEAVRREVLEWSLRLEAAGIRGDGLSFSHKEREIAQAITYNIEIAGSVNGSQIGTVHSKQSHNTGIDVQQLEELVAVLKEKGSQLKLDDYGEKELKADVQTLEAQSKSPVPKPSIIRECLNSLRKTVAKATGDVAKAAILYEIKKHLGVEI